jgi:hypothetical protein
MNKTLPALHGKAPALPPGAFEIGYTAHDGAQHRVPLAECLAVMTWPGTGDEAETGLELKPQRRVAADATELATSCGS